MPQSSILGPLLFLQFTSVIFPIMDNADESTLMAVVPSPVVTVTVAESLIRGLGRVSEWCDLCGMKLNASKAKTMIVPRLLSMLP